MNFTANHGHQEFRVSLESPGLEKIPQVPGKRAEVAQNHDARNAVSATETWGIFSSPRDSKLTLDGLGLQ